MTGSTILQTPARHALLESCALNGSRHLIPMSARRLVELAQARTANTYPDMREGIGSTAQVNVQKAFPLLIVVEHRLLEGRWLFL